LNGEGAHEASHNAWVDRSLLIAERTSPVPTRTKCSSRSRGSGTIGTRSGATTQAAGTMIGWAVDLFATAVGPESNGAFRLLKALPTAGLTGWGRSTRTGAGRCDGCQADGLRLYWQDSLADDLAQATGLLQRSIGEL